MSTAPILFSDVRLFFATLVIGKVEYSRWVRFYFPLMLIFGTMASVALYVMQSTGLGQ